MGAHTLQDHLFLSADYLSMSCHLGCVRALIPALQSMPALSEGFYCNNCL